MHPAEIMEAPGLKWKAAAVFTAICGQPVIQHFMLITWRPAHIMSSVDDGHCPVDTAFLIEEIPVEPGNIILAEYFINEDPGLGSANPLNIAAGDEIVLTTGIPVLDTPPGFNRLYIRVKDTDNRWSFLLDRLFYVYDTANKFAPKIQPPLSSAEYFINIDPTVNPDPGVGMGTPVAVNK
jgi:hypothetical protein